MESILVQIRADLIEREETGINVGLFNQKKLPTYKLLLAGIFYAVNIHLNNQMNNKPQTEPKKQPKTKLCAIAILTTTT